MLQNFSPAPSQPLFVLEDKCYSHPSHRDVSLLGEFYVNQIIQYVFFCVGFDLLSSLSLRFEHVLNVEVVHSFSWLYPILLHECNVPCSLVDIWVFSSLGLL